MNDNFDINPAKLLALSNGYDKMRHQCSTIIADLEYIKNDLRNNSFDEVKPVLNSVIEEIDDEASDITLLETSLEEIVYTYQHTENAILQTNISNMKTESSPSTENLPESSDEDFTLEQLWNLLNNTGFIPLIMIPYVVALLSELTKELISGLLFSDILNASSNQDSLLQKILTNGWADTLKKTLGVNASMPEKTQAGLPFQEYVCKNLADEPAALTESSSASDEAGAASGGTTATSKGTGTASNGTGAASKGAGAVSNWRSSAVSDIVQGVNTPQTYLSGGNSAGAENFGNAAEVATFAHTADAGSAASGGIPAPVWLIAGLGIGLTAAANIVSAKATGKDIGSHAADALCKTGSSITNWFRH